MLILGILFVSILEFSAFISTWYS